MAASFISPPIDLRNMIGASIVAIYTTSGTLGGTFKLQGIVDHIENNNNVQQAGHPNDIATPAPHVIAAAGNFSWDLIPTAFPWVQVVYTAAGGDTGTCDLWAFLKSGMGM